MATLVSVILLLSVIATSGYTKLLGSLRRHYNQILLQYISK